MSSEMTGTAFDFMRMDLLCPKCGKTNKEPISELVARDTVPCGFCGTAIDLNATRASITKFADEAKEIKKMEGR
jgi:hypothetical protein